MSSSIKIIKTFLGDDKGSSSVFEFCFVLPLFASFAFLILGIGKTLIQSIHSMTEARTGAWMEARLSVDIHDDQTVSGLRYREITKKVAGLTILPPLCKNGQNTGDAELDDGQADGSFISQVRSRTTVDGVSYFGHILANDGTDRLVRTQCEVFGYAETKFMRNVRPFVIYESAVVPNRRTWKFDDWKNDRYANDPGYDISCGYDEPIRQGLKYSKSSTPDVLPEPDTSALEGERDRAELQVQQQEQRKAALEQEKAALESELSVLKQELSALKAQSDPEAPKWQINAKKADIGAKENQIRAKQDEIVEANKRLGQMNEDLEEFDEGLGKIEEATQPITYSGASAFIDLFPQLFPRFDENGCAP